ALIGLAFADDPYLGGGEGFGWSQTAILGLGVALAALCFAPLGWNARALALLVSVGFTLGIAELVLRQTLGPRYRAAVQLDDRVLYKLIPGAQREYIRPAINGGLRIRYGINSQGYRGEELRPRGEDLRVVVYGDSFTQAEYTKTEDTFAARLEARLAQRLGTPVEVVNAGVAGYGPDQELRRLEDELPSLAPDLVIVAIYAGNDFGDLVRNKLYRLAEDGTLVDNTWTLDPSYARRIVVGRNEPMLKKLLRDVLTRLRGDPNDQVAIGHEARLARTEAALAQLQTEYRQYVVEGDNVVHELMSDPYNADVTLLPDSESARYRVAMMEQVIARMRTTAEARNVPLLLVLIPTPIDVADEHESGEVDRARYPAYRPETLTGVLEQIATRDHIPAVNLFGPFAARGARDLYLKGVDDHWNEQGQDFGAELVSDYVVANGLL
ncbi:MAG: GDSL-type esterase/lipase family protein, partial [Solirubrobacteraceae bacterium]